MAASSSKGINDLIGLQKAAVLMITIGPEKSAAIFKHLKEEEIEALTLEIANTRSVSQSVKDAVLDEFYEVCLAQQYIAEGGIRSKPNVSKLQTLRPLRKFANELRSFQP